MAKVKGPLFSEEARGSIGKALTFKVGKGVQYVSPYRFPRTPPTEKQLKQREKFKGTETIVAAWYRLGLGVDGSGESIFETAIERGDTTEAEAFDYIESRVNQDFDEYYAWHRLNHETATGVRGTQTINYIEAPYYFECLIVRDTTDFDAVDLNLALLWYWDKWEWRPRNNPHSNRIHVTPCGHRFQFQKAFMPVLNNYCVYPEGAQFLTADENLAGPCDKVPVPPA